MDNPKLNNQANTDVSSVSSLVREIEQVFHDADATTWDERNERELYVMLLRTMTPAAASLLSKAPRLLRSVLGVLRARAEEEQKTKTSGCFGTTGPESFDEGAPVRATEAKCEIWLPGYPRKQCRARVDGIVGKDGVHAQSCYDCGSALRRFGWTFIPARAGAPLAAEGE